MNERKPIANALPREVWRGPGAIQPLRMVLAHDSEIMASHRYVPSPTPGESGQFFADTPFLLGKLVLERAELTTDATGVPIWKAISYSEADVAPELMKAIWALLPKLCPSCEDTGYIEEGHDPNFRRRACPACARGEQYRQDGKRIACYVP